MERTALRNTPIILLTIILLSAVVPTTGCVGLASVLIHAWKGHTVEAAFDGLQGKRVAVVCLSDTNMYSGELARAVEGLLKRNVAEIDVVPQSDIYAWRDTQDWDELDYQALGEGVGAEMVVAIELASFRLYNGPTMYKGRANMATTVYDLSLTGEPVFTQIPGEHVFPANVAYATTDMSENKFRRQFMISLAHRIAKNFYAYDKKDDFAADPTVVVP